MNDLWARLARCARKVQAPEPTMPFGFEDQVLRRLASAVRDPVEAWLSMLRPALGLAFATAIVCVIFQMRVPSEVAPSLLVETENLIQLAVLK